MLSACSQGIAQTNLFGEDAINIITAQTVGASNTTTTLEDACNRASFKDDVTIPDGSKIFAGSTFVNTWRIHITGKWVIKYGDEPVSVNLDQSAMAGHLSGCGCERFFRSGLGSVDYSAHC